MVFTEKPKSFLIKRYEIEFESSLVVSCHVVQSFSIFQFVFMLQQFHLK